MCVLTSQTAEVVAAGSRVAESARLAIAEEFGAQALKLRTELLKDAESASAMAKKAVDTALSIPERKNLWRARAEGLFVGAALVLLGSWVMHVFSR